MAKGKKCIPGVICIENLTLGFLVIITALAFGFMYVHASKQNSESTSKSNNKEGGVAWYNPLSVFFRPNVPYTNIPGDVYSNPYSAPLKDTRYMVPSLDIRPDVMHSILQYRRMLMVFLLTFQHNRLIHIIDRWVFLRVLVVRKRFFLLWVVLCL